MSTLLTDYFNRCFLFESVVFPFEFLIFFTKITHYRTVMSLGFSHYSVVIVIVRTNDCPQWFDDSVESVKGFRVVFE
jgi:hypothetical protein